MTPTPRPPLWPFLLGLLPVGIGLLLLQTPLTFLTWFAWFASLPGTMLMIAVLQHRAVRKALAQQSKEQAALWEREGE